jgi:holin-like protein
MLHVTRIVDEWVPIVVALVASTALAIVVSALVIHWLTARFADDAQP